MTNTQAKIQLTELFEKSQIMPKRSKEDTEVTVHTIIEAVREQVTTLGYDKMSYSTLSDQTGISRTGISHHFPRKTDFAEIIADDIFEKMVDVLEFSSGIEAFKVSWMEGLKNEDFKSILRVMFFHIISSEGSKIFSQRGLNLLYHAVEEAFGEDAFPVLEWLIGRSIVVMLE